MSGSTIRKENLADLALSIPNGSDLEILDPDLERPGSSADIDLITICCLLLIYKIKRIYRGLQDRNIIRVFT